MTQYPKRFWMDMWHRESFCGSKVLEERNHKSSFLLSFQREWTNCSVVYVLRIFMKFGKYYVGASLLIFEALLANNYIIFLKRMVILGGNCSLYSMWDNVLACILYIIFFWLFKNRRRIPSHIDLIVIVIP